MYEIFEKNNKVYTEIPWEVFELIDMSVKYAYHDEGIEEFFEEWLDGLKNRFKSISKYGNSITKDNEE